MEIEDKKIEDEKKLLECNLIKLEELIKKQSNNNVMQLELRTDGELIRKLDITKEEVDILIEFNLQ